MCDEWMTPVEFPISLEKFHQLPRHGAFKYEYVEGQAYLTPQARCFHAVLDLTPYQPQGPYPEQITVRSIVEDDMADLERLFAAAFDWQQPFGGLDMTRRKEAARVVLLKTRTGGDGPWIRQASFVAVNQQMLPVGAIFVTLLPEADPADWGSFHWRAATGRLHRALSGKAASHLDFCRPNPGRQRRRNRAAGGCCPGA